MKSIRLISSSFYPSVHINEVRLSVLFPFSQRPCIEVAEEIEMWTEGGRKANYEHHSKQQSKHSSAINNWQD